MPAVFKIEEPLHHKYHGCGPAIGAATGGKLIDFVYLRDVFPDLEEDDHDKVMECLNHDHMGPTVRHMQALGEVFVGMCSCYEFVEM